MRGLRLSGLLALAIVTSCANEVSAPPAAESNAPASSSPTSTTVTPAPSSAPAGPSTLPPTSVSDPVVTQPAGRESATTTTTIAGPLSGPVLLRGDGMGDARFGDPMSEVEPWLRSQLGDHWSENVARSPLAASQWFEARNLLRVLTFDVGDMSEETGRATSLVVVFSDLSDARDDGIVHLAGWTTSSRGDGALATPAGLALGTSMAELQGSFAGVEFGLTDDYGLPGWFVITSAGTGEAGVRGLLSNEDRVIRLEAGADTRHPDDIPDPPHSPDGPPVPDLDLRSDGLGSTDFGSAADDLVTTLTERFGLPSEETNLHAPPDVFRYRGPLGYFPESELRQLTWYDPGLTIVVADGPSYGGASPGDLRLVNWSSSGSRLRLANGLGVGSALTQLEATYTDLAVGEFEECAGAFYPPRFTVTTDSDSPAEPPAWVWVHGSITWDWVSDVQHALNERGATLAVDGEYGPRTTAAVAAFQVQAAIDSSGSWERNGEIGPQTLAALGVEAPGSAPIAHLWAGYPSSC